MQDCEAGFSNGCCERALGARRSRLISRQAQASRCSSARPPREPRIGTGFLGLPWRLTPDATTSWRSLRWFLRAAS